MKSFKHFFVIMQLHLNKTCTVLWVWESVLSCFYSIFVHHLLHMINSGILCLEEFSCGSLEKNDSSVLVISWIAFGDIFKRISSLPVTAKLDNCVQIMKWNEVLGTVQG